jgi:shikimate kinase
MTWRNIFLVGPMGVGKTTIGKQLAQKLNLTFIDSDREIEEVTGVSIPLIFDIEGESGFRKREQIAIEELTQQKEIVLATGGGAVLNEKNRNHLKAQGFVIYLHASIPQLLERTAFCRNRPLLQTENPKARLQEIMQQRHPLYQEVADLQIETGHRSIRQVVKTVLKLLPENIKNINTVR